MINAKTIGEGEHRPPFPLRGHSDEAFSLLQRGGDVCVRVRRVDMLNAPVRPTQGADHPGSRGGPRSSDRSHAALRRHAEELQEAPDRDVLLAGPGHLRVQRHRDAPPRRL